MISSVAQAEEELIPKLSQHFEVLELTHTTSLPFENRYTTPQTLGKDRLAAVAGARALMPGRHCLTIDCGTCIKYDLITAEGVYMGGNIAPGAQMRAKAMHAEVKAWATDADGIRDFMLEQLGMSLDRPTWTPDEPVELTGPEWRSVTIARAQADIARSEQSREEEITRTEGRNAWLQRLRDSLPAAAGEAVA